MRHSKPVRLGKLDTGDGKIWAITPAGAVSHRTASAQLETAPTKRETGQRSWKQRLPNMRKCLFIFRIHHN